ncbi:MAG: CocE/NonD family hydrolase [Acidimicrobiia bacterium]|nr:CocE/NonD family hydrolase [Acidimicrobiia bacterium]
MRTRRSRLALLLLALAVPAWAGCSGDDGGDAGGTGTEPETEVAAAAVTQAAYAVRGSVEQVVVTGAEPGTELVLVSGDRDDVGKGTVDDLGSLLFRDVPPGEGYVVEHRGVDAVEASPPVAVLSPDDAPDPSLYAQPLQPGFAYIETRDGTLLGAMVRLPGPPEEGPYPTVVEYSGYDVSNPDDPEPSTLIAGLLGYATVSVNMRGTGCSGGAFHFFETLQLLDGYDVVETVATQPWVLGSRVGMVGISYPGISQLFVASTRPPHLAAIAPLSVIDDTMRATLYPGGILNIGFASEWADERQADARPAPDGQEWVQPRIDAGDETCAANQELRHQTPDLMEMVRDNPYYDPELADPLAPITFVDEIDVPVFLAGAWQDEQTGGHFPAMLDRFSGSPDAKFTLVNGTHADALGPQLITRWAEFLDFYVAERIPQVPPAIRVLAPTYYEDLIGVPGSELPPDRFTSYASYDEALAAYRAEPPVRVLFDNGAGATPGALVPVFEAAFEAWPPPEVEPTTWYLGAGGRLTTEEPTSGGADEYAPDPSEGERTTHEGTREDVWKPAPPYDWPSPEPGEALSYVTDPLAEDVVMVGPASVDLWLGSTAADTDVEVTITEVRPDGNETYVQSGWLRASHRELDEDVSNVLRPVHTHLEDDAEPLPSGEATPVRVEVFPFGHVFRAGSRIRLVIDAPGASRPLWRFETLTDPATNRIERSPDHPSRVVLPVVPGVAVSGGLPPCPALRGQPCRPYAELANTPAG